MSSILLIYMGSECGRYVLMGVLKGRNSAKSVYSLTLMMGGGEGNSLGFLKSCTRMVALMITSFKGCRGIEYSDRSEGWILDHFADSAMA